MVAPTKSVEQSWTEQYPELGTGPVPVEPCISPEYFELERERIFRRVWLNVCREEEIPEAGDYLVKDIEVCGVSLIVVRGRDGTIRAFHNVCRHRGNKLAWPSADGGKTSCRVLTCKFHGWTFQLDGRLTGVPDEAAFFDFDKSEHGLLPVTVDTWQGFVFIHLDPQPPETLSEYLGELGEKLSGFEFEKFPNSFTYSAEINVNWKVALDAFQEFYHLATIHQQSVYQAVGGAANPASHPLLMKVYPYHRTFSGPANPGYQPSLMEQASMRAGMAVLVEFSNAALMPSELPAGVNESKNPAWSMDISGVFPHFVIGVLANMYYTYHFWPLAVDRTRFEVRTYYPPAVNASALFSQTHSRTVARDTLFEDLNTMERVQAALSSGVLKTFELQDNELMIRHGHKVVEDFVGYYK